MNSGQQSTKAPHLHKHKLYRMSATQTTPSNSTFGLISNYLRWTGCTDTVLGISVANWRDCIQRANTKFTVNWMSTKYLIIWESLKWSWRRRFPTRRIGLNSLTTLKTLYVLIVINHKLVQWLKPVELERVTLTRRLQKSKKLETTSRLFLIPR